jgi:drug/metabolite transporter (DMT)-like permease
MKEDTKHSVATFCKIINIITFAVASLIWKLKLDNLSSEQQYILQALAAAITLFLIITFLPGKAFKSKFKVHSIKSYIYRAMTNAIGIPAMMTALKLTGANEVMTITQLSPAITACLAVFFFKEKVKSNWIIALILGISGVLIMLYGGPAKSQVSISSEYFQGIGFAMIAAISFALYNIICKTQTNVNDDHFTQAFYCFFFGILLALPFSIGQWKAISLEELLWALGSGVIGVLSVVCLFLSFKFSSVVRMSPHSYLRVIITALTMYILKDEIPSVELSIAICLILIGNFCIIFEKTFYRIYKKNTYLQLIEVKQT